MLIKLYEENTNEKHVQQVVDVLRKGGVIVYPTDTVYAIGCDIYNTRAIDRISRIKQTKIEKADFSFIFSNISQLSGFTKHLDNDTFKLLKRYLPGPYTFILNANSNVPRVFRHKKKTIGVKIPDNKILHEIVNYLGNPIMTTSIHDDDEIIEYTTDPELIHERYEKMVDLVIDGGYGQNIPSTVVDCTNGEPVIIREGIGEIE
jgi:tRNA threonylcarbamoyl adenosine modification protein (Sua5/YciO/YrdC/YwlC family)